MNKLETFKQFLTELRADNSALAKQAVLVKWLTGEHASIIKELLNYALNKDIQFYITSDNAIKRMDLVSEFDWSLETLLTNLSNRSLSGHQAIEAVNKFVYDNPSVADVFFDILDKDLKAGINITSVNKAVPGTIFEFKVALAKSLSDEKLDDSWVISRKLDGVRLIAICKSEKDIKFFSRQGKEFTTLDVLKAELADNIVNGLLPYNTVLDGELCIVDDNGAEDFQSVIKEVRCKDHTIANPMYVCFDIMSVDEFMAGTTKCGYKDRIKQLELCLSPDNITNKHIRIVEHIDYTPEGFADMQNKVVANNWEGLMARKNVAYEAKRTGNLLKIKSFNDAEYVVKGVDKSGVATILVDGKATQVPAIKHLIISHKGNDVGVGSGLTPEQRISYLANPDAIIGKSITVKYFEETKNQDGTYSLRFPVVKAIYENGRNV